MPFLVIILVACIVAVSLPSVYRSSTTILIEEQEIPKEFVTSTVTSYADQRIESINRRITSFARLLDIIERLDLYPEMKGTHTIDEMVATMAGDISLEPIRTELIDHRTGRLVDTTIAFELAYEGRDPDVVQQVANVLATLFLEENIKERVQKVEETSSFLEGEIAKIQGELSDVESRIASFKQKHMNELPEMLQLNLQSLNNIERNIELANQQLRNLKEREIYLQTQLSSVEPFLENEEELISKKRLAELKVQLVELTQRLLEKHPDVQKAKAEVTELEAIVDNLERSKNNSPDNPTYITLSAQHAGILSDIKSTQEQIQELNSAAEKYRSRMAATPHVEDEYNDLVTAKKNTQAKFDDLMAKLMEARVAHGLEKEQKGERFAILEAARLPEKPYKPNRMAIILIGIVLGIGAGVGTGALLEFGDDRIHNAEVLIRATQLPVLAGIPVISNTRDKIIRRLRQMAYVCGLFAIAAVGLAVIHFQIIDLHVVWANLAQRVING
jgi:polysaccharide chain length determinant protein (PEP-CTERM system associated)